MNQELLIWIYSGLFACVVAGVLAYLKISDRFNKLELRFVRIEVTFELLGRNAAQVLHSPHDPYGLDAMLDKYLDHNYQFTNTEWQELLDRCTAIYRKHDAPKDERYFAAQLAAVCWSMLDMPVPTRQKVIDAANEVQCETSSDTERFRKANHHIKNKEQDDLTSSNH